MVSVYFIHWKAIIEKVESLLAPDINIENYYYFLFLKTKTGSVSKWALSNWVLSCFARLSIHEMCP